MTQQRIVCCIGTRPEAIKMGPVIRELRDRRGVECLVLGTGQHADLLSQHLRDLDIQIDRNLAVMKEGQGLNALLARIVQACGEALTDLRPDCVLTHGDTTTTLGATLAAFHLRVPVGHVEAGLRTHNLDAPFPEEANRQLVDRLARYCFAPTELNRENLLREGVPADHIFVTGNTAIDSILWMADRLSLPPSVEQIVAWAEGRKIVLVTAHRREQFGKGIREIARALELLAAREDVCIVYPVHPNPEIKTVVEGVLTGIDRVRLVDPLQYAEFVALMRASDLILTDSGGLQEEAPSLAKPVLVMREETERQEALLAGTVELVGTAPERIVAASHRLLFDEKAREQMLRAVNPYGDGAAAARIVAELVADT